VVKSTGVRSDQTVILTAIDSTKAYPDALRRVNYHDAETDKRLKFLSLAKSHLPGESTTCRRRLT
jgi:hypothetical protein